MVWCRREKLAEPGSVWWASSHLGAVHGFVNRDETVLLTSGRAADNRSRVGFARLLPGGAGADVYRLKYDSEPILAPEGRGTFWSDGLTYPSPLGNLASGRPDLLFTGWKRGRNKSFANQLGIARFSEVEAKWVPDPSPLFPSWAYGTGSASSLDDSGEIIAVTAFEEPLVDSRGFLPQYSVRWATRLRNGNYEMGERISGVPHGNGISVAKPSFLRIGGIQFAWFSVREGRDYRVVGGDIRDGKFNATHALGLLPGREYWESNSVSYLHCWQDCEIVRGVYAGNGYGKEGLGVVSWSVSDLLAAIEGAPC